MRTKSVRWRRGAARYAAAALGVAAVAAAVLLLAAAGGSTGGYQVRAIFGDAANLAEGEDVKIDEVKVGTVGAVTATPQGHAAVVLNIENPGFQDFRADATCEIIPQSLLGEKYVNCTPTQPRAEGAPLPPALRTVPSGEEGEGQRLLPISKTSDPVGVDQLEDMTRLPKAQRLRIILNELGAGFAGRGPELAQAIRRANPALRELDKVLAILASNNKVLSNLAVESDRALAPIAAARSHVGGFIEHSNTVAKASARHLAALREDIAGLPAFLEQLTPATERLQRFSERTIAAFKPLNAAAPGIDTAFESLPGFSKSSTKYLESLGRTGKTVGPALRGSEHLLEELQSLGGASKPFSKKLSETLTSLRKTGGIERIMDFIFLGAGGANGYDRLGHFLRGEGYVNGLCVAYKAEFNGGCDANFAPGVQKEKEIAAKAPPAAMGVVMKRTLAVLLGMTPAQARAKYPGSEGEAASSPQGGSAAASTPVGGAASKTTYYKPGAEPAGISERLLEYLLGG